MVTDFIRSRKISNIVYIAVCLFGMGIGEAASLDGEVSDIEGAPAEKKGRFENLGRNIDKKGAETAKTLKEQKRQAAEALREQKRQAAEALREQKRQAAEALREANKQAKEAKQQAVAELREKNKALKEHKQHAAKALGDAKRIIGKGITNLHKGATDKLNNSCHAIVEQLRSQADGLEAQCKKLEKSEESPAPATD